LAFDNPGGSVLGMQLNGVKKHLDAGLVPNQFMLDDREFLIALALIFWHDSAAVPILI